MVAGESTAVRLRLLRLCASCLGCVDIVIDFGLEVSLLLFLLCMRFIAGHSQLWETLLHTEDFRKNIMAGFARGK